MAFSGLRKSFVRGMLQLWSSKCVTFEDGADCDPELDDLDRGRDLEVLNVANDVGEPSRIPSSIYILSSHSQESTFHSDEASELPRQHTTGPKLSNGSCK